ncbi:EF-P beta-lysylation protein EpmB [Pseudoalteromonas sp. Cnat2-41]|uniref:EF-P beta-lysylation protein EpmB n=1 Tax=unclassified Pseudoalteromonas TaxID=194690 RepID=UPI001EF765B6|nr:MULTISPECIES: EF-P beta-lysylation protein EpmB [unclassified Pseudoalteromonas]MCF2862025.1 EF-P beta-lysylation protein EpmB [Pseudoalteromonas sp. CNAT2-18]MCG7558206.1 EF-P beta-lysylation protein EpmB [Pseudoalteromonas sp. CNAT2-18.1]
MIQRIEVNLHKNWQKELADVVTRPEELLSMLDLPPDAYQPDSEAKSLFNLRVPRPFIAKMAKGDTRDPLLLQVLPRRQEFQQHSQYSVDPLQEQDNNEPGLLHKYRSRVLLMFKTACAINCRYCFRRHFPYQDNQLNKAALADKLTYIGNHSEINEVILSGGDPLMAKDEALAWFLDKLEQLPNIKRLRIHSRLPVTIPARITEQLCQRFAQSPLQIVFVHHINHANEVDEVFSHACKKLTQAGVTQLNQAVLLKEVNANAAAQIALSERLFAAGILPYYLHQLDKVQGAAHFEVSDDEARTIMTEVLSELPGFLVPKLVREVGGERSKTPIDLHLEP